MGMKKRKKPDKKKEPILSLGTIVVDRTAGKISYLPPDHKKGGSK